MQKILALLGVVFLLTACDKEKKLVVMSKGPALINSEAKTIHSIDGSGHEEKTIVVTGDKVVFALSTPAGEAKVELLGNGLYIINVKNDTIIGSYQKYSDPKQAKTSITQENLKLQIDSLVLLVAGKNITEANRNFFILPNKAVKITENTDAMIVGPFHRMRSVEKINGKEPEVYRFYSIKEIRETIIKLQAMTVPEKF